jgi:hypothetical protein
MLFFQGLGVRDWGLGIEKFKSSNAFGVQGSNAFGVQGSNAFGVQGSNAFGVLGSTRRLQCYRFNNVWRPKGTISHFLFSIYY